MRSRGDDVLRILNILGLWVFAWVLDLLLSWTLHNAKKAQVKERRNKKGGREIVPDNVELVIARHKASMYDVERHVDTV